MEIGSCAGFGKHTLFLSDRMMAGIMHIGLLSKRNSLTFNSLYRDMFTVLALKNVTVALVFFWRK